MKHTRGKTVVIRGEEAEYLSPEELDDDHPANPYDVLLRAGICRDCGVPCAWPKED